MTEPKPITIKFTTLAKFTTLDGAEFHAANEREFCHLMRRASYNPGPSFEDYLKETAEAANLYNGKEYDGSTPEALVSSLIAGDLLSMEEPSQPTVQS